MAILNGLTQKMKGSAGQFTFKSLNGQTVVSEGFRRFQRVSEGFRWFQKVSKADAGFRFQVSRGGDEQGAMSSEQKKARGDGYAIHLYGLYKKRSTVLLRLSTGGLFFIYRGKTDNFAFFLCHFTENL